MTTERGFAMADAIAAILIVALFATSILAMNTTMTRSVLFANHHLEATLLAKSLLENTTEKPNGRLVLGGRPFTWSKKISPHAKYETLAVIYVDVEWQQSAVTRHVKIQALQPRWYHGI